MKEYRYVYQPRKKYACAACGHRTMKRFVDTTTGELLPDNFGVCERIFSCGYSHRPDKEMVDRIEVSRPPTIPFRFQRSVLESTIGKESSNVLFRFLSSVFGVENTKKTFDKYMVGTSLAGDAIFWQIDELQSIRAAKKIQYFSDGKRNKARGATWLHWAHGFDESRHALNQCLFGQHLINKRYDNVFLVESEKTALICDICKKTESLFLSCGGLQNIGLIKNIKLDKDQQVIALPDNDANDLWQKKIDTLNLNAKILSIPELAKMNRGSDVADLLLTRYKKDYGK